MDFKLIAEKLMPYMFGAISFSSISIFFFTFQLFNSVENIEESAKNRYQSYLVADELRQSSDDLTRLVRTFIVTNNADYEKMYYEIIAIRDGLKPRPEQYHQIYWDLVIKYGDKPKPDGSNIAILELMRQLNFSEQEMKYLQEAKQNSDKLIVIEQDALNAVKGNYRDINGKYNKKGPRDFQLAINLLHNKKYHKEKSKIMKPIDNFFYAIDARTTKKFEEEIDNANSDVMFILFINTSLIIFSIATFFFILTDKKNKKKKDDDEEKEEKR
jgi:methyl-accepting chemotaxis protein